MVTRSGLQAGKKLGETPRRHKQVGGGMRINEEGVVVMGEHEKVKRQS